MDKFIQIKKKNLGFNVMRELNSLEQLVKELPTDAVYKFISEGNFSSIAFIKFVAERSHIKEMSVSTLRVGKKHLAVLNVLHSQDKLDKVDFIIGSLMKDDSTLGKGYKYYDTLSSVCKANGWTISVLNNHSKVILLNTDKGYYVIETSSNLNENPHMEQFSFEQSKELYDMYYEAFNEVIGRRNKDANKE